MDDKDIAIGILKSQRNQALDALAEATIMITKQQQQIATLTAARATELEKPNG